MASTQRSLVMGFSAGLPPAMVAPFFESLRASGYRGRTGLILAKYTEAELAQLAPLADFHVVVDERYDLPGYVNVRRVLRAARTQRGLRRLYPSLFKLAIRAGSERNSQRRWEAFEFSLEGLQALRYRHYLELLFEPAADADAVLISDLRDVLFQRDPFEDPLEHLEIFLEEPTVTIGGEPFNRHWITALYGLETLSNFASYTASCSGTVIGPREPMVNYLENMVGAIVWRRQPLGSHDQGVHNYLLRSGRLPDGKVVANGTGRVLTMGAMRSVTETDGGLVINADGSVPAILHQFDRSPERAARLLRRLAPVSGSVLTGAASRGAGGPPTDRAKHS